MNLMRHKPASQTKDTLGVALASLATGYSIEATPGAAAKIPAFADLLPLGTRIFIPRLPSADPRDAVALSRRLVKEGMTPVPHLAARTFPSRQDLADWLEALVDVGAEELLLIAGDRDEPAGPFTSTLDVLDTGLLHRLGFAKLRFAAHPEGHPRVAAGVLREAIRTKAAYAEETGAAVGLVTQFSFDAAPMVDFVRGLRTDGISLPISLGLPGPSTTRSLLTYAMQCGIGTSARVLRQRPGLLTKLARTWTPDRLMLGLAKAVLADQTVAPSGLHVFPFGGLRPSIAWFSAVRDGTFQIANRGTRFIVHDRPAAMGTPAQG